MHTEGLGLETQFYFHPHLLLCGIYFSRPAGAQGCSVELPEDCAALARPRGVRGRLRMVASYENRRRWAGSGPARVAGSFSTAEVLSRTLTFVSRVSHVRLGA